MGCDCFLLIRHALRRATFSHRRRLTFELTKANFRAHPSFDLICSSINATICRVRDPACTRGITRSLCSICATVHIESAI